MQGRSNLIAFLLIGLVIGGLSGYMTRPETTEFRLGPLSVEVRSDERARGGGPLTSSQVQHIAIMAAIGGVIGLAVGFAVDKRRG
jgi:membrane associated rhomboid family serine protease